MNTIKFESDFLNEHFCKLIGKETFSLEELQGLKNVMISADNLCITQHDFDLLRKMSNIQFEGINLTGLDYRTAEIESLNGATDEDIQIINNLDTDRILLYSFKGLTEEILDKLSDKFKFFIDKDCLANNNFFYTYYTKEDMKNILSFMNTIKAFIPEYADDINKFLIVYRFIGMNTRPDMDAKVDNITNPLKYVSDEESLKARSLKGALLEGKAVCHGFSLALCMCLDYVGINTRFVTGIMDGEPHGWVQVKIDDTWYNACLTTDWTNVRHREPLEYCLKSDEYFLNHGFTIDEYCWGEDNTNIIKCLKDYPRDDRNQIIGDCSFKIYEYFDNLNKFYQMLMQKRKEKDEQAKTNEISEESITNRAKR